MKSFVKESLNDFPKEIARGIESFRTPKNELITQLKKKKLCSPVKECEKNDLTKWWVNPCPKISFLNQRLFLSVLELFFKTCEIFN